MAIVDSLSSALIILGSELHGTSWTTYAEAVSLMIAGVRLKGTVERDE